MICPHCGEESFARKKNLVSGWKITGTIEVCALCGAEWKKSSAAAPEKSPEAERTNRLSALLGGETAEKVTLAGEGDRAFCRNCKSFLAHPFKCVCALTHEEVEPMLDGCKDFSDLQER